VVVVVGMISGIADRSALSCPVPTSEGYSEGPFADVGGSVGEGWGAAELVYEYHTIPYQHLQYSTGVIRLPPCRLTS